MKRFTLPLSGILLFVLSLSLFWNPNNLKPLEGNSVKSNSEQTNENKFIKELESDFKLQYDLFKKSKVINGKYVYNNGVYEITFTIDPKFQEKIEDEFRKFKLKYAAFVAIEPETGRVVAAVSSLNYPNLLFKRNFPTASTFKIVTAAAALDTGLAGPDTELLCGGVGDSCSPYVWLNSKLQIKRKFSEAFANSANPFFGNLGRLIGKEELLKYARLFGFNRSDYNFPWGRIEEPQGDYEIALTAAGLGKTTSSPFHEALIAQVIVNRGVMVKPTLIESIKDLKTGRVYGLKPTPICRVIKEKTAKEIEKMMELTVKRGTVSNRKYFRLARRYRELKIGGKTGTLSELSYPEGRCEWFTGFMEFKNRKLAISSVAVNGKLYYLSGYEIAAIAAIDFAKLNMKIAKEESNVHLLQNR